MHPAGRDPNHFSPDYFRDQTWDNADHAKSELPYARARAVYEPAGRSILDPTEDAAGPVFDKARFTTLFP